MNAPANEWHRVLLRADGQRITVSIDDSQVLNVDVNDHTARLPEYIGLKRTGGYIGLEDNKSGVEFRTIRIREIPARELGKRRLRTQSE